MSHIDLSYLIGKCCTFKYQSIGYLTSYPKFFQGTIIGYRIDTGQPTWLVITSSEDADNDFPVIKKGALIEVQLDHVRLKA